MDRNQWIGMLLITGLLFLWVQLNTPDKAQLERQKVVQDSIAIVERQADSLAKVPEKPANVAAPAPTDTAAIRNLAGQYGSFNVAAVGSETTTTLENKLMRVTFTNLGGRIKNVELLTYNKVTEDSTGKETKSAVRLMEDLKNRFEYMLPVVGAQGGTVSTQSLYFAPTKSGNTLTYRIDLGGGKFLEQRYKIADDNFQLDYALSYAGLNGILANGTKSAKLLWVNNLDKIEQNSTYERNYSTQYFKKADGGSSYCSCTADATEEVKEGGVKWTASVNQFFTSALIADNRFSDGVFETMMYDPSKDDLKQTKADLTVPIEGSGTGAFNMKWYLGPNEFDRLRKYDMALEDVIPFGSSILGTINRWVIRPTFNFLSSFISSYGMVILLLTLLVKLVLFPLSYGMLKSQAKMAALKPQIEKLKVKNGDDTQKQQMETMKLYQEYGVNPLGGCMPLVLQMPIWLALYRFFPAAIEFRQAPFLWITDLTNYETYFRFSTAIPLIGNTLSLFAILWTLSTLAYSWYSQKDMDMSANPAMKYMQYLMPVMFFGFFNKAAAGLSFYMFASNLLNIAQTVITRNFVINQDKLLTDLEKKKSAPKKTTGFMARMQQAVQQQQQLQEQQKQEETKKKGKK